MAEQQFQFLRTVSLIVYGTEFDDGDPNGLDLSKLRIKFSVKRSDTQTPNTADIRVYNVEASTAAFIRENFTPQGIVTPRTRGQVVLQAGYESNFGVIFQGNIKQVILGRESATDTFIDLICGDGDRAYNYAVVNKTIAPGATQENQVTAAIQAMTPKGVTAGAPGTLKPTKLPRGKVLFANARDVLRDVAQSSGNAWSIQNEKVNFIPLKSYLPGEAVIITSKTGMIGAPQQTNEGVNVKTLLNPRINVGIRIKIDNAAVERMKIDLNSKNGAANVAAPLTADGVYYVLVAEHTGDTRGVEWYTNLITLNIDVTTNPNNSVQVNYGN